MADKKAPKPEFDFDKKQVLAGVPLLARPVVGALIDWFLKLDFNHDGVPDFVQFFPKFLKGLPVLVKLAGEIDWTKLASFFSRDQKKGLALAKELAEALADPKVAEGGE